jgi:hypothetical protein
MTHAFQRNGAGRSILTSAAITNQNNRTGNATLATMDTLANLVAICGRAHSAKCDQLMRLTTPPSGTTPETTVTALVSLARNPTLSPALLYALPTPARFVNRR